MGKDGPRGSNKTHSGIYKLTEKSGLNEEDPNATVLGRGPPKWSLLSPCLQSKLSLGWYSTTREPGR